MNMVRIFLFISISLINLSTHLQAHNNICIVMDLGGVTLSTDKKAFAKHIGYWNSAKIWWNQDKMRKQLFELLDAAKPRLDKNFNFTDERGNQLPQLMIDWMKGDIQGIDAVTTIQNFLNKNPNFITLNDQTLLMSIVHAMFDPEKFIDAQKLHDNAYQFALWCKKQGYTLYVFSNWPNTLELMEKKHADFFQLCDGVVLSAHAGTLKPDVALYHFFEKETGCIPETTILILIDDQKDNINAAHKVGWHGVLCTKNQNDEPDFEEVQTKLHKILKKIGVENSTVSKPLVLAPTGK